MCRPDLPAYLVGRRSERGVRETRGPHPVGGRRHRRHRGGRTSRARWRSSTTSNRAPATPGAASSSSRRCARACRTTPLWPTRRLSAETREDFPRGVDVLTDKATWSGGEVTDLTLSLWGEPEGVTVDGDELRGTLPATTRVIPFAVTGKGQGGDVTTYAFLRVPGDDDLELALKSGARSPEVDELRVGHFPDGRSGGQAPGQSPRGRSGCPRLRCPRRRDLRHRAGQQSSATTPARARRGSTRARCRCE